jgi:hypothetical protein
LPQNISIGCAQSFSSTNFARAFRDRNQHDIHHSDAAQAQRHNGNASEENRNHSEDFIQQLRAFHRVPDENRVLIQRIEMVYAAERLADLQYRLVVLFRIGDLENNVVQPSASDGHPFFLGWRKVPRNG